MGMLVGGVWTDDDGARQAKDVSFQPVESQFRERVTADGSSGLRAEAGRHHRFFFQCANAFGSRRSLENEMNRKAHNVMVKILHGNKITADQNNVIQAATRAQY